MPTDISVALFSVFQSLFSGSYQHSTCSSNGLADTPSPPNQQHLVFDTQGSQLEIWWVEDDICAMGMCQLLSRAGRAPSCNEWPRMGNWMHQFPREQLSGSLGGLNEITGSKHSLYGLQILALRLPSFFLNGKIMNVLPAPSPTLAVCHTQAASRVAAPASTKGLFFSLFMLT